jgi:hypothetical protein
MNLSKLKKTLSSFHRRRRAIEIYEWWDYLNYAQKFSVSSLYKFGYKINFVRHVEHSSIVFMSLNGNKATVDQDGLIDIDPDIKTRQ